MPTHELVEILTSRDHQIDKQIDSMEKHTEYMEGFRSALGAALGEVKTMRETLNVPENYDIDAKHVATCESSTQTDSIPNVPLRKYTDALKQSRVDLLNASGKLGAISTGVQRQNKHIEALRKRLVKTVCVRIKRETKLEEKLNENKELKRKNLELEKMVCAKEKSISELKSSLKHEILEVQRWQETLETNTSALSENKILLGQLSQLRKCLHEKDREISNLRSDVGHAEYLDVRKIKQNSLRSQHVCDSCAQFKYERDSNYKAYQDLLKEAHYYRDCYHDLQSTDRGNYHTHKGSQDDLSEYTKPRANPHMETERQREVLSPNTHLQGNVSHRNNYHNNQSSPRPNSNTLSSSRRSTPVSLYPIDESDEQITDEISVNNYMEPVGAENRIVVTPLESPNLAAKHDVYKKDKIKENSFTNLPAKPNKQSNKKQTPVVCTNEDYLHGNADQLTLGVVWHPQLRNKTKGGEEQASSESGASENCLHGKKKSKKKSKKYSRSTTEDLPSKDANKSSLGRFVKYKGHEIDVLNFSIHNFREILWNLESESAAEPQTISNDFLKFLSLLARKLNGHVDWADRHSLGKPKDWLALRGLV